MQIIMVVADLHACPSLKQVYRNFTSSLYEFSSKFNVQEFFKKMASQKPNILHRK